MWLFPHMTKVTCLHSHNLMNKLKNFLIKNNMEISIITIVLTILPLLLRINLHKLGQATLILFLFYSSYLFYISYIDNTNKQDKIFFYCKRKT